MKKVLVLSLFLLPGINIAQEASPPADNPKEVILAPGTQEDWEFMVKLGDKDGNGELTNAELKAIRIGVIKKVIQNYRKLDANGDGSLKQDEYFAFVGKYETSQLNRFNGADRDSSNGLTKEEAQQTEGGMFRDIVANFEAMDIDGNGEVTWRERLAYARSIKKVGKEGVDVINQAGPAPESVSEEVTKEK